ncbi:heterokaryon incompatibility, partial [Lepidopterella palustris CBS 459.81]
IDVHAKCLIEATCENTFAALSYVWGKAKQLLLTNTTREILFTPGGLECVSSALPRTIADAIALCESLDYRYLWVDALCIQQDDRDDMARQISGMGNIYTSASLTIVNASSVPDTNANTPLPRFSPSPMTIHQHEEHIRDQNIILTKRPPFSVAVQKSVWYSRGWTLQEFHLSKRLLFFTDHQVFF